MQIQHIPYADTKAFSKMVLDYIAQKPSITSFQQYPPLLNSIPDIIASLQTYPYDRDLLSSVLLQQYEQVKNKEASLQNIRALKQTNTFAVITGHQTNLFTGPLYFIYKVAATIKLAQQLEQTYTDYQFVPIYWMGSEDHDFEEINHVHLWGSTLTWEVENSAGASGRLDTQEISKLIDQLEELGGTRFGKEEVIRLLRTCYLEEKTLAAATRAFVHTLFGKYGLIIIDQDNFALKSSFKNILKQELQAQVSHQSILATNKQLEEAGYHQQAYSRPINLFYLTDEFRNRIDFENKSNLYKIANTNLSFTPSELLADLEAHPDRYSPNVIMRPIYQQHLIPAVANIGGGGEMAYWLQLKEVFNAFQVPYPMILLRNSVLWMDQSASKKLDKLGISLKDLFQSEQEFITQYALAQTDQSLELNQEKEQLQTLFNTILEKAMQVDQSLEKSVKGQEQKILNTFERLEEKLLRAEKRKHELHQQQFANLKAKLFPKRKLQERYDNVIPYLMEYGLGFVDTIVENLEPMRGEFTIVNGGTVKRS